MVYIIMSERLPVMGMAMEIRDSDGDLKFTTMAD
jgi:hypothetical protein